MKFPVLWSGSEILAMIKLLYNPRVNKVLTLFTHSPTLPEVFYLSFSVNKDNIMKVGQFSPVIF